jgi:hypothetical protein
MLVLVRCVPPPPVEPESLKNVRPGYNGYSLAVPLAASKEFTDQLPAVEFSLRPINLIFDLKKNGRVERIEVLDSVPQHGWDNILERLMSLQFYPGRKGAKPTKQRLPVYLLLAPERYQRHLQFPVNAEGGVDDPDLYWKGMRLNGVDLPMIEQFGSYFLDVDQKDTSVALNYLLARLTFDSNGRITERNLLHSDFGQFTDQILDAANWGEYHLPQGSDPNHRVAYLRVAKLRTVADPSRLYDVNEKGLDLPDRERLRLFPDTLGLLFKPIPIRYQNDGIFSLLGGKMAVTDTLFALIKIDEKGRVASFDPVGGVLSQKNDYLKLMTWIRFHPALAFDGTPRRVTGIMEFAYEGSTMVRIRFLWLPGESLAY